MNTPVEETGTQKIMVGIKMDRFENGPYSLMFLKNKFRTRRLLQSTGVASNFQVTPSMSKYSVRLRLKLIETR